MMIVVFNSFKKLVQIQIRPTISKTHHQNQLHACFQIQIASFSSKNPSPPPPPLPNSSFCVNFLIDSCGLSSEQAQRAAKKISTRFSDEDKRPRSVISFLEATSFSKTHISKIIYSYPILLFANLEKNIKPKIKLLQDMGLSDSRVADIMGSYPGIMVRSLRRHIIPNLDFIQSFAHIEEDIFTRLNCFGFLLAISTSRWLHPNIAFLRENGVSNSAFAYLMSHRNNALRVETKVLKEVIERIKGLGLELKSKRFAMAVCVMCSMTNSTWDYKMDFLKSLGWSEEQIYEAFRRVPMLLACTPRRLKKGIEFYAKHLNWDASIISRRPVVLMFNLNGRVLPRIVVWKILISKGIITKDKFLIGMLNYTEEDFLRKYVFKYQDALPELLETYKNVCELGRGTQRELEV